MNEQQRTQYLEAMGIQMFVPRWVLPAAAPSRQAPLPELESATEPASLSQQPLEPASPGNADVTSRPKAVGGMVSGIIGELAGTSAKPARAQASAAQEQSPAKRVLEALEAPTQAEPVHFALTLWRVSEKLLVIDSHQARQALPTGTLLHNMLIAKGLRIGLPKAEVLTWPVAGSEGGWDQAGEMVQAFLQARLERQPVQFLWLMGEAAYRAVGAGGNDYQENIGQFRDLIGLGCLATVLPSLADMLRTPSLKIPAWQAIKAQKIDE